jgi:hypothetical protein
MQLWTDMGALMPIFQLNIILKQIKQWNCRRLLFFSLYASSDYYEFVSLQISLIEKSKIVGRYSVKTKKYEFDFQTLQGVLNTTLHVSKP